MAITGACSSLSPEMDATYMVPMVPIELETPVIFDSVAMGKTSNP